MVLFQHELGHILGERDFTGPPDGFCDTDIRTDHLMCGNIQWKANPVWVLPSTRELITNNLLNNGSCLNYDYCSQEKIIKAKVYSNYFHFGGYSAISTNGNVIVDQTVVPIYRNVLSGNTGTIVYIGNYVRYGHLVLSAANGVTLNPGLEIRLGSQLSILTNSCFPITQ